MLTTQKRQKDHEETNSSRKSMLIHDLTSLAAENHLQSFFNKNKWDIVSEESSIHNCIGCFGCWIKTPGSCVLHDGYQNMGARLAQCDELVLVSRCCYGGASPFVKNVLDRSIPYIHPYFVFINGEMHHRQRYRQQLELTVFFYGSGLTEAEKETAREWVNAMAINLYCNVKKIEFVNNLSELEGLL